MRLYASWNSTHAVCALVHEFVDGCSCKSWAARDKLAAAAASSFKPRAMQLVAIASAAPDAMHEGAELSMWVAGTRGALAIWRFEVRGQQPLAAPGGETSAWWLVREPVFPYDLRIEVWLDPAHGHWPLKLRQTQVPGGEPLEWTLREAPQSVPGS